MTSPVVFYPNRKLGFARAAADPPVNGIGDASPVSLGNVALANAAPGDVVPGCGTVVSVTQKVITFDRLGSLTRVREQSDKFARIARDVGELLAMSAHLGEGHLGDLCEMISRDPAAVWSGGVLSLHDGPDRPGNEGRPRKNTILKDLPSSPFRSL